MLNALCLGNKNSSPLVFLHGLLGSAQDFMPMMQKLQHHFYCIAIDLPGHGASPLIYPLSFKTTLQAIVETISHLTSFPISLVGYSLGGRLALLLHYDRPSLIHSMIILSAHPGISPEEKPSLIQRENRWISLLKNDLPTFLTLWYKQPLFHTLCLEKMVQKRSCIQGDSIAAVMQALSLAKQPSLWGHLSNIPSLWLYGAQDAKYSALYTLLPPHLPKGAIPGASHAIHIENFIKCSDHIKEYFKITD